MRIFKKKIKKIHGFHSIGETITPPNAMYKIDFRFFFFIIAKTFENKKKYNAQSRKNKNFKIFVPMGIFKKNIHVTRG